LDYAKNRYHQPGMGRFMTPDPYGGSISLGNPGSWNRYSYVGGDPVNGLDPLGLCNAILGGITQSDDAAFGQLAGSTGANQAYGYAHTSEEAGAQEVMAGPTQAAQTVVDAIMAAAADLGPINIVAYSGGAGAFAAAVKLLPANVIARIASVTYLSPGANGNIPTGPWKTKIYTGVGVDSTMAEWFTTWHDQNAGESIVHPTSCYHTDTSCLVLAAGLSNAWSTSNACSNASVFSRPRNDTLGPPSTKTVVTPGFGPHWHPTIATGFGGAASGYESGQWNYTDSYYDYMGAMGADWNYDPFSYMREYFALRRLY